MKFKKCIKCGIRIHQTDWEILKEMSLMPICDNCLFVPDKNKKDFSKKLIKNNPKKIIEFPLRKY
jgi:hypothetical protein